MKDPYALAPAFADKYHKHSTNIKQYYLPAWCKKLAGKIYLLWSKCRQVLRRPASRNSSE